MIRVLASIACAALLGAAAPPPAQGLEGNWRNTKNSIHLKVQACGPALCGTVTWAADKQREKARKGSGRDLLGAQLLTGLKRARDGSWQGKVFLPAANVHGTATVRQVNDSTIEVSGCTLMGLLCKTQHWHRF
ncbi:DUF2147 domain-containing protein [Sphingomonas canadensis]|uniref:DUF2147 domain-containing protein n=1 Tax=Sphingomonas canadensis TaxID=1219257 RepID=A0ABW3H5G1_9SPHN|nr:DUF2147 domain-containing protein [Sphingomonas canadensis]